MTRAEALEVLKLYRNWNEGQTSISLAMRHVRTQEDDVLDARRNLIITASKILLTQEYVGIIGRDPAAALTELLERERKNAAARGEQRKSGAAK